MEKSNVSCLLTKNKRTCLDEKNYVDPSIPKDEMILVVNLKNPVRKRREAASWSLGRLVCVVLESPAVLVRRGRETIASTKGYLPVRSTHEGKGGLI